MGARASKTPATTTPQEAPDVPRQQEPKQPLASDHQTVAHTVPAPPTNKGLKNRPGRKTGVSRRSLERALRRRIAPCPIEEAPLLQNMQQTPPESVHTWALDPNVSVAAYKQALKAEAKVAAKDAELQVLKKELAHHQARSAEQDGFLAALLEDRAIIVQRITTAEQQAAVYHQAAQLLHAQCSDQEQKLAAAHYAVLDWQLRCQGLTELAEEAAAALPTQSPEMRRFWAATLPAVQKRLAELGIAFC